MKTLVMTTTTPSLVLLLALYVIPSPPLTQSSVVFLPMPEKEVVDRTCKQTPYYDICACFLRSDPRSSDADVRGLALIMVGVIEAKAKETLNHIKDLIKRRPEYDEKQALNYCAIYYDIGIINTDVPIAIGALKSGDNKFAEQYTDDAANEAGLCEKRLSGTGMNSPLTKMNKVVHDVAAVASAITRILLKG